MLPGKQQVEESRHSEDGDTMDTGCGEMDDEEEKGKEEKGEEEEEEEDGGSEREE